jgi:ABC-type phosphate/phosphonate transport system permease subunit
MILKTFKAVTIGMGLAVVLAMPLCLLIDRSMRKQCEHQHGLYVQSWEQGAACIRHNPETGETERVEFQW